MTVDSSIISVHMCVMKTDRKLAVTDGVKTTIRARPRTVVDNVAIRSSVMWRTPAVRIPATCRKVP